MHTAYKPRTSDEALDEHLKLQKTTTTSRKQMAAPMPPMPPTPPPPPAPTETARLRSGDSVAATEIYIIGAGASKEVGSMNIGVGSGSGSSNPATMERKQHTRMSWANMRRKGEEAAAPVTPSPQTTRSYVSTVSTGATGREGLSNGSAGGTVSGRTTAASGRISTSGVHTISGSNNTLNDIISDYHSHEAGSSDYHYNGANASTPTKNGSFNMANGSTVKLLPAADDESNQQTKCSVFRGLVLCICLNVTYANVVRFPRELDRNGLAYLVPYIILLFLVGLPIVLLEISVGQFLGQGAAHTWRASPIFKGACIVSRFASWLSTVWVSLQAVLALAYMGMFLFNSMPFRECVGSIKLVSNGYTVMGNNGQDCLEKTFLTPFWENPLYFGLLSIGLICLFIVVMLCTHNGKVLRRSLFFFGLVGFFLLCCLAGWEVHNSLERAYFPKLWEFQDSLLLNSNLWFNALMQVLFATNCGFGALPMVTGKFLYKGDAVRTSVVYLCFNLLINAIAVTLFMVQFDFSENKYEIIEELKPLTAIYDRYLLARPTSEILVKLMPSLLFALVVIAALVSIMVAIYTATRLVPRHPNYVVSLVALVMAIISLSAPKFFIARILDSRIVGTIAITALIFELIAVIWIYGAKNIYTDLEFSIGRPIFKAWMGLWYICPAILTGLLVWWCSDDDQDDLLFEVMPRWAPILFALAVIFIIACIQIFRQVEYNFFGMICEASKPAKEWGPADPLARHAWKQWRSVCQDTGRRDFTLRRRGTRDYTHSIKKGQYSTSAGKYANGQATQQNWKSSTPGNSSPNYSGSMFGDSAIEEDISVDKFPGITQQFVPFQVNEGKQPLRHSHRSRAQQRTVNQLQLQMQQQQPHQQPHQQSHQQPHQQSHQQQLHQQLPHQPPQNHSQNHIERRATVVEKHREVVYIRRLSDDGQHATRIEITPSNESITYGGGGGTRNPLGRANGGPNGINGATFVKRSSSSSALEHNRGSVINVAGKLPPAAGNVNGDHICWRKFTVNAQEFSTEL